MHFVFIFILLFISSLEATKEEFIEKPIPLANFDGVSAMVAGCVNAITGDYVECSQDLVIQGPEPLTFERFYASSDHSAHSLQAGWRHNHHGIAHINPTRLESHNFSYAGDFLETSGRCCRYYSKLHSKHKPQEARVQLDWDKSKKGLTNCGAGIIGGRTNPKNTQLVFKHKDEILEAIDGMGNRSIFSEQREDGRWDLEAIHQPNGHSLLYKYVSKKRLEEINLVNSQNGKVYATINLIGNRTPHLHDERNFRIEGSDGRWVQYKVGKTADKEHGQQREFRYYIEEVHKDHGAPVYYQYKQRERADGQQIAQRNEGDKNKRLLKIEYFTREDVESKHDFRIDRVKQLLALVGADNQPIVTHRFQYFATTKKMSGSKDEEALSGATEVLDAYGHKTVYAYSKEHRLESIKRYSGTQDFLRYSSEKFAWGKEGPNAGNLLSKHLKDGQKQAIKGTVYVYDDAGNILQETTYGNISGHSQTLLWEGDYPIENGCERYSHYYTYSQDGKNLLTAKWEDNGNGEFYKYDSGTDRVAAKYITDHGKIRIRHFYRYNEDGVLAETIVDNCSREDQRDSIDVTEIKVTRVAHTDSAPIGFPAVVEEHSIESNGRGLLIKRVDNRFSKEGYLIEQERIDSNWQRRYKTYKNYDCRGRVTSEKDALGQITEYTYSDLDELVSIKKNTYYVQYSYDQAGRRYKEEELADGVVLTTFHQYDYLGNRTKTIDSHGQETLYYYDDFKRLIRTVYPAIPNEYGQLVHTSTEQSYDVLNNVTKFVDQAGNVTLTTYNIYGKPTSITYPDGTYEKFTYNLDGSLAETRSRNGLMTRYIYDFLGREIEKNEYAADGSFLSGTKATYDAFHLTSFTEADGEVTTYAYDRAGRLIATQTGSQRTTHEYDEFNRVSKTYEWYGSNEYKLTTKKYDFLDRVVEETISNKTNEDQSKTTYTYDVDGNIQSFTDWTHSGPRTTSNYFNGRKDLILTIDPSGAKTSYHYNYNAVSPYGQLVLEIIETDPLGYQTITTYDALQQPNLIKKVNPFGQTVAECEIIYTGCGQKKVVKETVYNPISTEKQICTRWNYDAAGNILELIEAEGLPEQQITKYIFNHLGQKEQTILGDGTTHRMTYDSKGRLSNWSGPDFFYTYTYDACDRVIVATDNLTSEFTSRYYDHDKLIAERLAHGLQIRYTYDEMERPVSIIYPDNSSVKYRYNGANLYYVERKNPNGENKYTFAYFFHRIGQPSTITNNLHHRMLHFDYDLCERPKSCVFQDITQEVANYDQAGNKLNTNRETPLLFRTGYFYDDLYQMKKEEGPFDHRYKYDSLFNCVEKDNQPRTINARNLLLASGAVTFTYDSKGALASRSDQDIVYTHDSLGRLTSVAQGNQRWSYSYDAFHRRIRKRTEKQQDGQWHLIDEELYLYQDQNEIGGCNPDGTFRNFRMLGASRGAEIGASLAIEIGNNIYTPFHDLSGNIVGLFDSKAKLVESYQFDTFGEEITSQTPINPWRYSSKRHDTESGFIYFGRRHYDPSTARWTSPDPLGFDSGPNLYAYLENNPLINIDMYGLTSTKWLSMPSWLSTGWSYAQSGLSYGWNTTKDIGAGMYNGFFHPVDTAYNWHDDVRSGLGYNRLDSGSYRPMSQRFGEILGTTAFLATMQIGNTTRAIQTASSSTSNGFRNYLLSPFRGSARTTSQVPISQNLFKSVELNRFHQSAQQLSPVGKQNIRTLRGWANSKGWVKEPNPFGKPERWGVYVDGNFSWRLKIKPEGSLRKGLDLGSNIPRFEARLNLNKNSFINPFTGEIGKESFLSHNPLETTFY